MDYSEDYDTLKKKQKDKLRLSKFKMYFSKDLKSKNIIDRVGENVSKSYYV